MMSMRWTNIRRFLGKRKRELFQNIVIYLRQFPFFPQKYRALSGTFLEWRYKRSVQDPLFSVEKVEHIRQEAVADFESYVLIPVTIKSFVSWVEAYRSLFRLAVKKGDFQYGCDISARFFNQREALLEKYGLLGSEYEFIARDFAFASIGRYEMVVAFIRAQILGLIPKKKLFLQVPKETKINNAAYLDYFKKYIDIVRDQVEIEQLSDDERLLTVPLSPIFLKTDEPILGYYTNIGRIQNKWDKKDSTPFFRLKGAHRDDGWITLEKMGMPKDAWFVCFHVREPGWTEDKPDVKGFRDSHIDTYFGAMKAVVDAGGWVVRIGNPSMSPLPEMDRVIDYAHSDFRSDWMDVFLCASCRFFVGTSSGMYTLAEAFGVPKVMVNLIPGQAVFALGQQDLFLPKLLKFKKNGECLSFRQLMAPPVAIADTQYYFDQIMGLECVDNTSEEIEDVVLTMIKKTLLQKNNESSDDVDLQRKFKGAMDLCLKHDYGDDQLTLGASIGALFLKKHHLLIPDLNDFKSDVLHNSFGVEENEVFT